MKVSLTLGTDRFRYSGDASQDEVQALIDKWLSARQVVLQAKIDDLTNKLNTKAASLEQSVHDSQQKAGDHA